MFSTTKSFLAIVSAAMFVGQASAFTGTVCHLKVENMNGFLFDEGFDCAQPRLGLLRKPRVESDGEIGGLNLDPWLATNECLNEWLGQRASSPVDKLDENALSTTHTIPVKAGSEWAHNKKRYKRACRHLRSGYWANFWTTRRDLDAN
ncbi:hypothetical protein B0H10DRAFT_1951791 [Mycena sp. CBHHK59/15]|nr:hypothetical protein B0H10DRAFT_1951791 [Mycena sp. CBHHK59/15]